MKTILTIILITIICSPLRAGELDSLVTFLPDKKIVPSFTANGNEHRISYNKLLNRGSIIGSIGASFPVANFHYRGYEAQLSVASSIYTYLNNAGLRYQVVNVDFFVDVLFDIALSHETSLRLGTGHTSQHLVDDAFETLGFTKSINYARDYYQIFIIHHVPIIHGFVYGGTYYTHSFLIDRRIDGQWLLEAGSEFLTTAVYRSLCFYAALDVKLRSEVSYGSTQSYQMGFKMTNHNNHSLRLAYTFRTGIEDRGQFYNLRSTTSTIGFYFDF